MIFRTFEGDSVDKWTKKIGIFGKSLEDLGKSFSNFKNNVKENGVKNTTKDLFSNLKNGKFTEYQKKATRNDSGKIVNKNNIDTYIEKLKPEDSIKNAKKIVEWNTQVQAGTKTWDDYYNTLSKGEKRYIPDLISSTKDLTRLTGQDLVKANESARKSVLENNEALKRQTLTAKASRVAMKGLTIAANAVVDVLIFKGIEAGAAALDTIINRVKYAKEAMGEAEQAISESQSNLKTNTQTINSNKKRFLELSKGVDKNSENKTLSTEDYEEYLSISQDIASIAPELITGYDEQGNALLRIGNNAKETGEILEDLVDTQKQLAAKTVDENLGKVAKGVYQSVKEAKNQIDGYESKLQNIKSNSAKLDFTKTNADGSLANRGVIDFNDSQYLKYGKEIEKALEKANIGFTTIGNTIELKSGFSKEQLQKAQDYYDLAIEKQKKAQDLETAELKKNISEKEQLIDQYYQKMSANLVTWSKNDFDYQSLSSNGQKLVDKLIPEIDWDNTGKDLTSDKAYKNYIQEHIIEPLTEVPESYKDEVNKAIAKLLSFDDTDLNAALEGKKIQNRFNAWGLDIDVSSLYKEQSEAYDKLQESLKSITTNSDDLQKLQDFTSGFTTDDAERWEKLNLGVTNVEQAMQNFSSSLQTDYSSAISDIDTSLTSATNAQEAFSTALEEQAQQGTLSESTIANLRDNYDGLENVLERTANGIVINTSKLSELNAEEQKSIDKDITSTRKALAEQFNSNSLAIAEYKLQLEDSNYAEGENADTIRTKLELAQMDQKQTKEQIEQLDLLGLKYDNVTSKTNAYLNALSSTNIGAEYDTIYSSLEQMDRLQ